MLYTFAFDRIGVAVGDLYFRDPNIPGGAEQGVRLEVRRFERGELRGSPYSAQPIAIEEPIWRADLLETVANPGSLDRAHHHPKFNGWDPGRRTYVEEMSTDPVAWVGTRLADVEGLLSEAGVDRTSLGPTDEDELRAAVPEILDAVKRLLDRVRAGEAARPIEASDDRELIRASWL